jgi:hypothetical protein
MYSLYLLVVGTIAIMLTVSVVKSVSAMTPRHRPSPAQTLTERECLDRADQLWTELDDRRKALSNSVPAANADNAFTHFRVEWLQRHREAEGLCAVESQSRVALREVFRRLEQTMDLYTTHTVQYAGEVGPTVDALREAMAKARQAGR